MLFGKGIYDANIIRTNVPVNIFNVRLKFIHTFLLYSYIFFLEFTSRKRFFRGNNR
jgi:hypothetical protein